MDKLNLENILENLGLTQKQAKVYLTCLEYGPLGITELSKKSEQKKTTVFDIVKILLDEKILTYTRADANRRLIMAEDPQILTSRYEEKLSSLKKALPILAHLKKQKQQKAQIKYYEGKSGIKQILENILNCQSGQTSYWGSVKVLEDVVGPRFLRSWIRRRIKTGTTTRALRIKSGEIKTPEYAGQEKKFLRHIRYAPKEVLPGYNLSIFDNKVAFMSSREESFGFIVESQEFNEMMLNIFNLVWEMSEPAGE